MTAFAASLVILLGCLLFFALHIGRYPLSYIDESFFNYPAIRFLHGSGFIYPVSVYAPFGKTLWAYHGPFYPHLQVLVFWLFGISQETSRLPNLMAGYLAASLMAYSLWREQYRRAPLIFAVLWLGDRSTQELQYARMDGLALLSVALAFIMTNRFFRKPSRWNAFGLSIFSTAAMGFNPITGLFWALSLGLMLFLSYRRKCLLRNVLSYGVGLVAVVVLVLACVGFHPAEALEQLQWHMHLTYLAAGATVHGKWLNLLNVIRWSRWFFLALVGFTLLAGATIACVELRKFRDATMDRASFFRLSLALFSLAGLASLVSKAVLPYDIIYFSLWPITLLAAEADRLLERGSAAKLCYAAVAVLLLAWLPSATWNALRVREEILYSNQLKHGYILEKIKQSLPANAEVVGDPITYMLAEEDNLNFTPASWEAEQEPVPPKAWLLVSESEEANPAFFDKADVRGRSVLFCANSFPGAKDLAFNLCLLRPLSGTVKRPNAATGKR